MTIPPNPVPLSEDSSGVLFVTGTRVTLDTVVSAFLDGATAEEIVQQYPTLALGDVYAVLAYYLRRRDEVDEYIRKGRQTSETVRQENERRFDPTGVRARLLARRNAQGG